MFRADRHRFAAGQKPFGEIFVFLHAGRRIGVIVGNPVHDPIAVLRQIDRRCEYLDKLRVP